MSRHPRLLNLFERFDALVCALPIFRIAGDHMLLHMVRV
jgi:hypothetical protein